MGIPLQKSFLIPQVRIYHTFHQGPCILLFRPLLQCSLHSALWESQLHVNLFSCEVFEGSSHRAWCWVLGSGKRRALFLEQTGLGTIMLSCSPGVINVHKGVNLVFQFPHLWCEWKYSLHRIIGMMEWDDLDAWGCLLLVLTSFSIPWTW